MANPSYPPLRPRVRSVVLVVAGVMLMLMGRPASGQVTWPTWPPGFKATTNDVSVWAMDPLPEWATKALKEDNVELLVSSLGAMPDAKQAEAMKHRLFYQSLSTPSLKITEWCLKNGASVGTHEVSLARRGIWIQPLGLAIQQTNVPLARLLIAAGASPLPIQYRDKTNALRTYFGHAATAALTHLRDLTNRRYQRTETPAALEMAGLIAQGGLDPVGTNSTVEPAFRSAVDYGYWSIAEVLLTNQPSSVLRSERGALSLSLALEHGLTNAARFLREVSVPVDVFTATLQNDATALRAALARGASVDARDAQGRTPLMLAVGAKANAAGAVLLEAGADLRVQDSTKRSLAHVAADAGNIPLLARLKDAGIPLDELTAKTNTPLMFALVAGETAAAQWLLASGHAGTNGSPEALFNAATSLGDERVLLRLWHLLGTTPGRAPNLGGPYNASQAAALQDKALRLVARIRQKAPMFFPGLWTAKPALEQAWAETFLNDRPLALELVLRDVPVSQRRALFPDEALLAAVSCNLTNLAGWLIDQGFSVTGGGTPTRRWPADTRLLMGHPTGTMPLEVAVRERHAEMVALLLSRQANPEAFTRGNNAQKPLSLLMLTIRPNEHGAWRQAALDCTAHLLAAGANPLSSSSFFTGGPLDTFTGEGLTVLNQKIIDAPELVDSLLTNCVRTDITNRLGETLLHYAAKLDRTDATRVLGRRGANLNAVDRNGVTPLQAALAAGKQAAVATLRSLGATADLLTTIAAGDEPGAMRLVKSTRPGATNRLGEAALHLAAGRGWTKLSQQLIAAGAALEAPRADGGTPLTAAVEAGSAETVELLVTKGASARGFTGGHTPLHAAVMATNEALSRRLMTLGAEPLAMNRAGKTPLGLVRERKLPALETLLGDGMQHAHTPADAVSLLFKAAESGTMEVLEQAAKTTALGSLRNARGESLLWAALASPNPLMPGFLMTNGVGPNLRDPAGNTVLHTAVAEFHARRFHYNPVSTLLALGADVAATNLAGATPMHLMQKLGWVQTEPLPLLLAAKAPLEARDAEGRTPLLAVLEKGSTNLAHVLLGAGADPKARTRRGRTALHLLAEAQIEFNTPQMPSSLPREVAVMQRRFFSGRVDVGPLAALAKAIRQAGVDEDAQDADGDTALHLAARAGNGPMEKVLLEAAASVTLRNKSGETALFHLCTGRDSMQGPPLVPGIGKTIWSAVRQRDAATLEAYLKVDPALLFAPNGSGAATLLQEIFTTPESRPILEVAARYVAEARKWRDADPQLCAVLLDDAAKLQAGLSPGTASDRSAADWMKAAVLLERTNVIALLAKAGVPTVTAGPDYANFPAVAARAGFDAYDQLAGAGSREDIWSAAADGDALKVEAILRNKRTLVTATNAAGLQPMHVAAAFGRTNVAIALLANGADVNARESRPDGGHPLQIAAYRKHVGMVRWLVNHGAQVNAVGTLGNTAVHEAVAMASPEILTLLLERGGDLTIRNNRHMKPADFGMSAGRDAKALEEIIRILVNHGETLAMGSPFPPGFGPSKLIRPPVPTTKPLEPQAKKP